MTRIAVVFAMEKEARLFESPLSDSGCIATVVSGIGKVNAALKTAEAIREMSPDYVISAGAAGTFQPSLKIGDLVIAFACAYHDVWCGRGNSFGQVQGLPLLYESDAYAFGRLNALLPHSYTGLVISGDQFYISKEEDERQRKLFPEALAVDMESAAVAQTCFEYNVPFVSVRIISDVHDDRQAEHYGRFWEDVAAKRFVELAVALEELNSL